MKLSAQQVCDILNASLHIEGFVESIRGRVNVTDEVANKSDVSCSIVDGGFDSSPLGFIQALTDEVICIVIDKGKERFSVLKNEKEAKAAEWDKYEEDLEDYNKANGTDHKPDARPLDI